MGKKIQLKKFLRIGSLFLVTFFVGCASGGSIGPEFEVNNRYETDWVVPINQVLHCKPGKLIVCETYGFQKYCRCDYPPRF